MQSLAISGYDIEIEYIKGTADTCADMLYRIVHPQLTPKEEAEIEGMADIADQTFQINVVNAQPGLGKVMDKQRDPSDSNIEKTSFDLSDVDLSREQARDANLSGVRKQFTQNDSSKAISRYVLIDVIYYISVPDGDPIFR